MAYSLVEKFGSLPVDPELFSTLDPKLKWMDTAVEGSDFCTNCGTVSPSVPRSHHQKCDSYKDADAYVHDDSGNPLGDCPECNGEDLSIESSREQGVSIISCSDCCFSYVGKVPEETLIRRFLAAQ